MSDTGSDIPRTESIDRDRMLRPSISTKAFGSGRPRRVPDPAATTITATDGRTSSGTADGLCSTADGMRC